MTTSEQRACPGYDANGEPFDCAGIPGTPWTPVWCWDCDERRRRRLSQQLQDLARGYNQ